MRLRARGECGQRHSGFPAAVNNGFGRASESCRGCTTLPPRPEGSERVNRRSKERKENGMNALKKGLLATAAAGTAAGLAVLGIASTSGAAVHPRARPHALHAATATGTAPAAFQDVNTNAAKGWCHGA